MTDTIREIREAAQQCADNPGPLTINELRRLARVVLAVLEFNLTDINDAMLRAFAGEDGSGD